MYPFLKICGITRKPDARLCAAVGAGALGAVFYEKSPRNVTPVQAKFLFEDLPEEIARVGVFVDTAVEAMLTMARAAGLDTVQMHGCETADTIRAVQDAGFHVIKVLKTTGDELLKQAEALPPGTGILVECGKGALPGGNAAVWNWADAAPLAGRRPIAIAGGLSPDNIRDAAAGSHAAGFDISSGVESTPGIKDAAAIKVLAEAMADLRTNVDPFPWKGLS